VSRSRGPIIRSFVSFFSIIIPGTLFDGAYSSMCRAGLFGYWSISGSEVVFTLCSIHCLPLVIFVHTLLAGARFLDHNNVSISVWFLGHWLFLSRCSINFSINAWCLDHCFIFVRHTFVSNLRSCHKLTALQCLFTEVIWVVFKWSRTTLICFLQ